MWRFRKRSRRKGHMKTRNGGYIVNRFTVILKSGKEFTFDALEAEVSVYDITHRLEEFTWVGAANHKPLYICPSEVAAIYYEKLDENNGGKTQA